MSSYGLIHIYCGKGKGKTTAATGLAVRCAGSGGRVLFVQFFKNSTSGEIMSLNRLDNVKTMHCEFTPNFYDRMTDMQRTQAAADYTRLLRDAISHAQEYDLLVLDEIISSCNCGIVAETEVTDFLDHKPAQLEVVLTGRNPSQALLDRADYVTSMEKVKHPYDRGVHARKGVEF